MDTTEHERENAYYRELAQFDEVEKIRLSLHGFTPNQFQEKYLELWKHFLAEFPLILYPDDLSLPDDMFSWEYEPHPESVAAQSYPNVERLLIEARDEYADWLANHYDQIRQTGSLRQVLAERLLNLAVRLENHTAFLQELSGNRHQVRLPRWDIEASEKPEQAGIALALLAHFLEVYKQFLELENANLKNYGFTEILNFDQMMLLRTSDEEAERRGEAVLYTQNMIYKYSSIHGMERAFNDYHWWWEDIDVTGDNGNVYKRQHYDFPRPYCHKYFRRFVELFLSRSADDSLYSKLAHEFKGDEIDAEYIESLIRQAKDINLFKKRGVVAFDGDNSFEHFVMKPGEFLPQTRIISRVSSDCIFYGSKTNNDRVEAIRRWLKRRAKELAAGLGEQSLLADPIQFRQSADSAGFNSSSQPVVPQANSLVTLPIARPPDTAMLTALIKALEGQIFFNVAPSDVASLITLTLFDPESGKALANSNLRLYAIAKALKFYKVAILPTPSLAALIGKPCGIAAGKRLNKQGEVFEELFEPLKDAVLGMKTNAKAQPRKS